MKNRLTLKALKQELEELKSSKTSKSTKPISESHKASAVGHDSSRVTRDLRSYEE
jgi:hypothetical protein